MEILYKVGDKIFKNKKDAEFYEDEKLKILIAKMNSFKHFYLPLAFEDYRKSLEKLRDARKFFRIKNYTQIENLHTAHKEWLEKKRILRENISEYRNTKKLIRLLLATKKQ